MGKTLSKLLFRNSTTSSSDAAAAATTTTDHAYVLRTFYCQLSSTIDAETVACHMFAQKQLTQEELDSIDSKCSEPITAAKQLLTIIMKQPCEVYWCFLEALKQAGQDDLRKMIIFESLQGFNDQFSHVQIIQQHYVFLIEQLVCSELLNELFQARVLSQGDRDSIDVEVTPSAQNKKLLKVLRRKTRVQFHKFLDALDKTGQQHIRNEISAEMKCEENTTLESTSLDEHDSPSFSLSDMDVPRIQYSELTEAEAIADGGFGVVYRAKHPDWEITVAYKELKTEIIPTGSRAEVELKKEAKSHILKHDNVIKLYAMVFEPKHYGVVLEYVPHKDLQEFVFQNKPVDMPRKVRLAHGVVRGMKYLHSVQPHPVIHGDLKTQNVLVGDHMIAKICDFGLSKWKEYSETKTLSRSKRRGTVTHIPPEIWSNINQRRTTEYDVYSFGILFWELISEEQPFRRATHEQIEVAVKRDQRPELNVITGPETLVKCIKDCISRCWHQSPNCRPPFADLNNEIGRMEEPEILDEKNSCPHFLPSAQRLHELRVRNHVAGVTQLDDVVYVVCRWTSTTISRFRAPTHERLTDINVKDLGAPRDIVACHQTSQLYVSDWKECIWRVSPEGEDIKRWWTKSSSDTFEPDTLSLTSSRLLVTSYDTNELMQLDAGGCQLRRVPLPGYMEPRHAVESPIGSFIVSHRNTELYEYQVSEVNTDGEILRKFNGPLGYTEHIAVDSQGNIFVADAVNSRVLLLDCRLQLRRTVFDKDELNDKEPRRLCYDEQSGQLLVGLGVSVDVFDVLRR